MAWRQPGDKPLSEPMMVNYWRIAVFYSEEVEVDEEEKSPPAKAKSKW